MNSLNNIIDHSINRGERMNEFVINVYFKETEVTMQEILNEVCVSQLKNLYEQELVMS